MAVTTYTTPGWHQFNVPTGVKHITVTLDGAGSNTRPGGLVTGDLEVSDKWVLYIMVGQAGKAPSAQTGGGATTGGGGAGGGGNTQGGGWSGGGATFIRVNSTTGTVKAVAGGAGGDSGDAGPGGDGGGTTGRSGRSGTSGTSGSVGQVGNATGGTQSQGGNGGTSSSGAQFNGVEAVDAVLAAGGKGGEAGSNVPCYGGGGGGGGYHPGGGGQAAATGYAPGGGGGGGSSYVGGLTGAQPGGVQGGGGTGNGSVTLNYLSTAAKNQPPTPPTAPEINDKAAEDDHLTKSTGSVKIDALVNDPDSGEEVYLFVRYSTSSSFSTVAGTKLSAKVGRNHRAAVTLTGLAQNTHYYARLYTKDEHGLYSTTYTTIDWWTNRKPFTSDMTVNTQGSGMTLPALSSATFAWIHNDPDVSDYQTGFILRYRVAASSVVAAGAWKEIQQNIGQNLPPKEAGPPSSAKNEWVFDPEFFKGNTFYEWQVRTKDGQGLWGDWGAELFTFFVSSTSAPPRLLTPPNLTPVDMSDPTTFTWRFVDPETGDVQKKADLRFRVVGDTKALTSGAAPLTGDWTTMLGELAPGIPGAARSWTLEPGHFIDGYTYEWEVRTYDTIGATISDWSDPFRFYAIDKPGSQAEGLPVGMPTTVQGELGCGTYRVFIYQQGGQIRLGEVEPIHRMSFKRVRDDISNCIVHSSGYSVDCGAMYGTIRSWLHELVVFRDGVRVWEGPITRITYTTTSVEFEAKDVMAYVYRRIMRQGYNDAYRLVRNNPTGIADEYLGLLSVVKRASLLITQALAPYDPNVLPYLTTLEYPDDAKESRVVANWSTTAWEEVDDLAATAGLDYTVVGRRILLWDTHRPIGRLPEMRDGDFSESPIVTEYGMLLANFFAVTNGSGVVGYAWSSKTGAAPYGPIEQLASAYNDSASASDEIQTPEALAKAQEALIEQAKRNASGRWPTPLIVRIPDNSSLSPRANLGFQQLIPGVWLPLRSVNTPRQVTQWQKLDSVDVDVEGDSGEVVKVVLSPAPNGGNDPDADAAIEEA